ncbi:MAG: serine/threonine protein kinase, partial [Myxococcales bacterium]|nr:serine/threonine protein kinase [Myxococcales bacterium]
MKYCRTCGREYEAALDYCPEDGDRLRDLPHSSGPRLAIGDVVDGRYRIEGLLGAGGMGWVYRATQRSVERTIALKILPPSLARDEVAIGRFMREAKAASLLSNPHATTLFEFGQDQKGTLYLAMEFVDGPTLGEYLERNGRLPPIDACDVAIHLCNALEEAHQKGILHRDLKPSNVILVERPGHRL